MKMKLMESRWAPEQARCSDCVTERARRLGGCRRRGKMERLHNVDGKQLFTGKVVATLLVAFR